MLVFGLLFLLTTGALAHLGIAEGAIVEKLVPNYAKLVCALEGEGFSSEKAILGAGQVEEAVRSDFGFKGREFLLVSVQGVRGVCAQCSYRRIAAFELSGMEIVFRFEQEGSAPEPHLRLFKLFPGDEVLTLALSTGEINLNMGGYHRFRQEWYRPRALADQTLEFEKVWSGIYDFATTDNLSWLSWSACATMDPVEGKGRWDRRVRSLYGKINWEPPESWGSEEDEEGPSCICRSCGVEIERRQTWGPGVGPGASLRLEDDAARRIDRFPVHCFPFDLPMRSRKYARGKKLTSVRFDAAQHVEVVSPSGALVLVWDYQAAVNQFRIVTQRGRTRRAFSLPPSVVEYRQQAFVSGIDSLGWQADERRFFAVVSLGPEDRALLSFAVGGTSDYWERPLSAAGQPWDFGFVLKPDSTPGSRRR